MGKRIQFVLLFIQAFIVRHIKYIGIGAIIGFFLTLLFLKSFPLYEKSYSQHVSKIGIVGRFTESTLPLTIVNQISRGLTIVTPDGDAAPSIAQAWETDANQTSYTFHLNPNIYWHDGKQLIASDIVYKIQGASFTPVDNFTLKVSLKDPYAPFPILVSRPIIRENNIGLGSYRVIKTQYAGDTISQLTLVATQSELPNITYKFYSTTDEAILAFKRGDVNILQNIQEYGDLTNWKNIKITGISLYDKYTGIYFNLKNPLFKDKEVRQALAYAVPQFDDLEKVYTPISPLSWAYSQKIRLYRFDPETSKKILSKSDISSSSAQLTVTTFASNVAVAQKIADAWNAIGLSVKVKVENTIPQDYQMLLLTQPIPADPDQYPYWQSKQEGTNITHYSNLKIDKLLEDGRKTADREKRKKIYADFQRYLVDDAPVIFLFHPKVYTIERK